MLYSRIYKDFKSAQWSTKNFVVWCHREVSVGDGVVEDSGGWCSLKSCILESWKFAPK